MNWIFYAIAGHLLNGCAFIVDKVLLQTAFKRASTYAISLSLLSIVFVFGLPFIDLTHGTPWVWMASLGYGASFVFALVAFFRALKAGESTRIVPLIGTGIPLATLIGTILFAQEYPSVNGLIGFALLLISVALLTIQKSSSRTNKEAISMSLVAIFLFAASNVLGKIAFQTWPFFTVFVISRLAAFAIGLILLLIDKPARQEILALFGKKQNQKNINGTTRLLLLGGQIAGAIGFLLVNIALSKGNAGLVTALQATQYTLIALIAWFGGKRMADLLGEEQHPGTKLKKIIAFIGIAIGLWFTVR